MRLCRISIISSMADDSLHKTEGLIDSLESRRRIHIVLVGST